MKVWSVRPCAFQYDQQRITIADRCAITVEMPVLCDIVDSDGCLMVASCPVGIAESVVSAHNNSLQAAYGFFTVGDWVVLKNDTNTKWFYRVEVVAPWFRLRRYKDRIPTYLTGTTENVADYRHATPEEIATYGPRVTNV